MATIEDSGKLQNGMEALVIRALHPAVPGPGHATWVEVTDADEQNAPAARAQPQLRGSGCRIANTAPCGSARTANSPIVGMGVTGIIICAPALVAASNVACASSTAKYAIHTGGVPGYIGFMKPPICSSPLMTSV